MTSHRNKKLLFGGGLLASFALVMGCSANPSGGDTTPPPDGDADTSVTLTYMDTATGSCDADPLKGVDVQAAIDFIDLYQQPASGIYPQEALPEPIEEGIDAVYLNNDSQVAGIMQMFLEEAADAAGVNFINVSTGTDAQSINAALDSVVELEPDIVFSVANDGTFYIDQIEQLKEQGAAIVYASSPNADQFGLDDSLGGYGSSYVNGEVLASGAVAFTCGTATEFVFYHIPEFGFSQINLEAAQTKLAELAPDANLRVVDISIADPSPADKIISDLQAHPETQFFITPGDQFQIGLAEKAKLAGIENALGMGQSSVPVNFTQMLNDEQVAGYAVDFGMFMWQLMDEGLRKHQGVFEPYEDWAEVTRVVGQVITARNADNFTSEEGFIAYPDFREEYLAVWNK